MGSSQDGYLFQNLKDNETISRSVAQDHGRRCREERPHGNGHQEHLRLSDAFRSERRIPAADHQETPPALHHSRAAVVSGGRHEHQVPARQQGDHLGRVGFARRRTRPHLRLPVAQLAGTRRPAYRPDCGRGGVVEAQPRLAPPHRQRLERGRHRPHGPAALPRAVPVLRGRGAALLPALPAQCGCIPRRTLQHRLLCAAHDDDGAGVRAEARRFCPHPRRRPHLSQPFRSGARTALAHAACPARDEAQSGGRFDLRIPL